MGLVVRNSDATIYSHAATRHPNPDAHINIFAVEKEGFVPASDQVQALAP
jgi:hypothetical protein